MSDGIGSAGEGVARYKILVVDDNAQNLELLEAYMSELPNVTTVTATNGIQALEKVASENPDLVLLDIMMPRMSGFEVCKQLKADPDTRDVPVIMVTALGEFSDIERARECGADEFISKPVNRAELAARVQDLLSVRRPKTDLWRARAGSAAPPRRSTDA